MTKLNPWSVQIELVEGCSRQCSFCGINAIRKKPGNLKFMSEDLAERCAENLSLLCPDARYEFAMHGEPTLHPDRLGMITVFRHYLPRAQFQLTTNGSWLRGAMPERLSSLFQAGIDFVVMDTYEPERAQLMEEAHGCRGSCDVLGFYDECQALGISPWHNHRRKLHHKLILMDDLSLRDGEVWSRSVQNHAGSSPARPVPPIPLGKTCTNPFRELTICWNGDVNICCMDWRHELVMGNVSEDRLREIWFGPRFQAARAVLQSKNRRFVPCSRCDKGAGARSGLLPRCSAPTLEQMRLIGVFRC